MAGDRLVDGRAEILRRLHRDRMRAEPVADHRGFAEELERVDWCRELAAAADQRRVLGSATERHRPLDALRQAGNAHAGRLETPPESRSSIRFMASESMKPATKVQ